MNSELKFGDFSGSLTNLFKIISVSITATIIISLFKDYLYFKAFGITISDYLDLSDALLLFFEDIIQFFSLMICCLLIAFYFNTMFTNISANQSKFQNLHPAEMKVFLVFTLSLLLFISTIIFSVYLFKYHINQLSLTSLILVIVSLISLILAIVDKKKIQNIQSSFFILFTFSFFLLSYILVTITSSANSRIYKIKNHKNDVVTKCILYDNSSIISNSDTPYLGRTKSNLFFYDLKNKTSIIINSKDVKKIEINNSY